MNHWNPFVPQWAIRVARIVKWRLMQIALDDAIRSGNKKRIYALSGHEARLRAEFTRL